MDWIYKLDSEPKPLTPDQLNLLFKFALISETAGGVHAAKAAQCRIEWQAEHPGQDYLSFDRPTPESLRGGSNVSLVKALVPAAPVIGDALDKIDGLAKVPLEPTAPANPDSVDGRAVPASTPASEQDSTAQSSKWSALLDEARAAFERGDHSVARAQLERLIDRAQQTRDAPGDVVRDAQVLLADIFFRSGELERAEVHLRASLNAWKLSGGPSEPAVRTGYFRLTLLLLAQGRFREAIALRDAADLKGLGMASVGRLGTDKFPPDTQPNPFDLTTQNGGGATQGEIDTAWREGDPQRSLQLSEKSLEETESTKLSPQQIRSARWLSAVLAVEVGNYRRARELVTLLLEGDDLAGPVEGQERSRVFALRERIDRLEAHRRDAEDGLFADWPASWWTSNANVASETWSPVDEETVRKALGKQVTEPTADSDTFDMDAERAECARMQRACALEDAVVMQRRIVAELKRDSRFSDAEREEAERGLAAIYRVLGEVDAAREVELGLRP